MGDHKMPLVVMIIIFVVVIIIITTITQIGIFNFFYIPYLTLLICDSVVEQMSSWCPTGTLMATTN